MRPNVTTRALACLALGAGLLTADAASARPRSAPRYPVAAEPAPPAFVPDRGRGRDVYAVRPGFTGTITASTPNQYGNLGGPSSGGGGGN